DLKLVSGLFDAKIPLQKALVRLLENTDNCYIITFWCYPLLVFDVLLFKQSATRQQRLDLLSKCIIGVGRQIVHERFSLRILSSQISL
ncbi:MAG: hypothetical protein V2I33_25180, partial [Kangiellaceae bacterium]|nr:hypothetical protein [Kangiellaceae bacterium]